MEFTYSGYVGLIRDLVKHGYPIVNYHDWTGKGRCAIMRHDIDTDVDCAVKLAELEAGESIRSTYFVLLTSDFYNPHSAVVREKLRRIISLGHEIGLHYDELSYPDAIGNTDLIIENIQHEGSVLSDIIGSRVSTVSMHRPSKGILEADISIPGFINSYGRTFFRDFKYVSDSRRRWREPIEEYVSNESYERFHILTHAFWYGEHERDLADTLNSFVSGGASDRYDILDRNFTRLSEVTSRDKAIRYRESEQCD